MSEGCDQMAADLCGVQVLRIQTGLNRKFNNAILMTLQVQAIAAAASESQHGEASSTGHGMAAAAGTHGGISGHDLALALRLATSASQLDASPGSSHAPNAPPYRMAGHSHASPPADELFTLSDRAQLAARAAARADAGANRGTQPRSDIASVESSPRRPDYDPFNPSGYQPAASDQRDRRLFTWEKAKVMDSGLKQEHIWTQVGCA